ncbi:MAG: 3-oxoadipate enol-lactonase [Novosphingobium sp.]
MNHVVVGDGTRIAYCWDGRETAPVLMLSSSLGTDAHMWDPQVEAFAENFRVLRYDMRGHGGSDAPAGAYSMDRLGRDVVELLDALGLERVHFCGLSLGGMIGQWLAVHAPERINRLVLANTSACMAPPANWQARIEGVRTDGIAPLAEATLARWFTPEFLERGAEAVANVRTLLLANNPVGYTGCCAAVRDMDQRPTACLNRLPTLVIVGRFDPAISVTDGVFLADQAVNGRLVILDAAHLSNVECPQEFAATVTDFLLPA